MDDRLSLRGLAVETLIGVYDWEQTIPQRLTFDLTLPTDATRGARDDDLSEALDYGALAEQIQAFCAEEHFQLIETLAERLCARLLADFDLPWLELTVHKPGAIASCDDIALTLRRCRDEA